MKDFLEEESRKIRQSSLWRSLKSADPAALHFSTNDYLGYSRHPEVLRAAADALQKYGTGGRSSRLIAGTLDLHSQLEAELARFKGAEAALLFPTGFMANLGVISALLGPGDAILLDRLSHASLIDAAKLARCRIFVYEHASPESLERALKRTRNYPHRLVATDSVFSMDGDFAPLPEIAELCRKHGAWLLADDAHALGIFGSGGSGLPEHFGLQGRIEIVVGTCSKALGAQGGFVAGSKELIDFLVNRARPFIYTTAVAPPSCGAALAALRLIRGEPHKREHLLAMSQALNSWIQDRFPQKYPSSSPIAPLVMGEADRALGLSRFLEGKGIHVPAIRPPTVPKGQSRLRFSLTSDHTAADLRRLVGALQEFLVPK